MLLVQLFLGLTMCNVAVLSSERIGHQKYKALPRGAKLAEIREITREMYERSRFVDMAQYISGLKAEYGEHNIGSIANDIDPFLCRNS